MSTWRVLLGDVREKLATLPERSVQTCITSPPYWNLRDYGTATWEGGDPACDHKKVSDVVAAVATSTLGGGKKTTGHQQEGFVATCGKCGARRIDSQLGLEPTPDAYVAAMVEVFRQVRRVLRDDGTVWLNLGDSYTGNYSGGTQSKTTTSTLGPNRDGLSDDNYIWQKEHPARSIPIGLKPKDLCGIPWRVAFALQADGWYLRSEIIWAKLNPMPESVTDRPTKAHEQIFMLTKSPRYYYDAEAIKEEGAVPAGTLGAKGSADRFGQPGVNSRPPEYKVYDGTRNKRSVWTVATQPFSGAHFAVFPESLIEPCILAGTSERGQCPQCGSPWGRVVDVEKVEVPKRARTGRGKGARLEIQTGGVVSSAFVSGMIGQARTLGWQPSCICCSQCDSKGTSTNATQGQGSGEEMAPGVEQAPMGEQRGASSKSRRTEAKVQEDLRTVQGGVLGPEVSAVLLPEVFDRLAVGKRHGESVHAGRNEQVQGRQDAKWTNPEGTPGRDGEPSGAEVGDVGVGASHQRGSERQQGREPGGVDECEPREDAHEARFGHTLTPYEPIPCVVLDPFLGSGTTGAVAIRHQRSFVGCELNPEYVELARKRIGSVAPLLAREVA